jgi:hypothetical protein
MFLPIDVLSIESSLSGGGGSRRISPQEDDATSRDAASNEAPQRDSCSTDSAAAALAEQSLKLKRRSNTATPGSVMDGRRGSVEFDSESFFSLGGGGRFSFMDLSEPAQVNAAASTCILVVVFRSKH